MSEGSLPPEERRSIYAAQKAHAASNLPQLSYELSQWRKTGVLKDGLLRDMGHALKEVDPFDCTRLAEQIVTDLCVDVIAAQWNNDAEGTAHDNPN